MNVALARSVEYGLVGIIRRLYELEDKKGTVFRHFHPDPAGMALLMHAQGIAFVSKRLRHTRMLCRGK